MRPSRVTLGLVILAISGTLLVASVTPAGALTCTGAWQVVPTPNSGPVNNQLLGVVAIASNDVWTVGLQAGSPNPGPIILHWNGAVWSLVPPAPASTGILYRVDGAASSDVWAVGDADGSAALQHWNGSSWSSVSFSVPRGGRGVQFRDVVALATNDVWAVGWYTAQATLKTLTEHWNGTAWSVVSSPNAGRRVETRLIGIGARSPGDIWAVGTFMTRDGVDHTLAEHWNGSAWSIVATPPTTIPGNVFLADVSTFGTSKAWAVGTEGDHSLIERWNGSVWTIFSSPSVDFLQGIDAISRKNAWAGGSSSGAPVIEHWNGTSWTMASTPAVPAGVNGIAGIDHSSATDVWGVGDQGTGTGSLGTLAEHFC